MDLKHTHTPKAGSPIATISLEKTYKKIIPLKVNGRAKRVTIFVTTLLLLISSFCLQAQNDSIIKMGSLKELPLEELMNLIVITATRFEQKTSEAPSTIQVITSRQIAERGYEDLDDALRDIPGFDIIHQFEGYSNIRTFRGGYTGSNNRIMLIIDGVVENSILGAPEMGGPAYSLHNVDRIEIISGPGSALYGANAFNTVIQIITKKGEQVNGLQYQKGFGSYNTSFDKVMLGINKSHFDLVISGTLLSSDGPKYSNRHPNFTGAYLDKVWSFNSQLTYIYNHFTTTVGCRIFETPGSSGITLNSPTQLLNIPSQGHLNIGNLGILPEDIRGEKPSLYQTYFRTSFIQSEFTPKPNFSILSRIQFRETGLSEKSYAYYTTPDGTKVNRNIFAHYSNRIAGAIHASYTPTKQHQLSAGIQIFQDNLELNSRGINQDTRTETIDYIPISNIFATFKPRQFNIQTNVGMFAQYALNTKFLKMTNFTLGVRFDKNSVYGSTTNPRLGIVNQPTDQLTLKLLYGSAFRAPTNFELFSSSVIRDPNPDLKPEKINTYELNIIYTPIPMLVLQTNLFQNDLTDIIATSSTGNGRFQIQNAGKSMARGLEAKIDVFPKEYISGFLNFSYLESTQNNGVIKTNVPNISKFKGNAGVVFHIENLFSVCIIENWVGDRSVPITNPLGKVDGYFITNFVLTTKELFDNRVTASLNIRNIFNKTWYDPGVATADGNFFSTEMEQPGINGLLKIAVSIF